MDRRVTWKPLSCLSDEVRDLLEGLAADRPLLRSLEMCDLAKAAIQFRQTLEAWRRISYWEVEAWSKRINKVLQQHLEGKNNKE